jgi:hypothetical protein
MDSAEKLRMVRWIERFETHPVVVAWLKDNPPPVGWLGSRAEYAYTEMPFLFLF